MEWPKKSDMHHKLGVLVPRITLEPLPKFTKPGFFFLGAGKFLAGFAPRDEGGGIKTIISLESLFQVYGLLSLSYSRIIYIKYKRRHDLNGKQSITASVTGPGGQRGFGGTYSF